MPAAQAKYDYVASLPEKPGYIRINIVPETLTAVAADEFVSRLPTEYIKRTKEPNNMLLKNKNVNIRKTIPYRVVLETIRKMKTIELN